VSLRLLASLFARPATDRERQRSQPSFRNLAGALDTAPVFAGAEPDECFVDTDQCLGPHLEQSEVDVSLDTGVGKFEVVTSVIRSVGGAPVANTTLDVRLHLAPASCQYLPQACVPRGDLGHVRLLHHASCRKRPRTSVSL
jgi:hypothetical protein